MINLQIYFKIVTIIIKALHNYKIKYALIVHLEQVQMQISYINIEGERLKSSSLHFCNY